LLDDSLVKWECGNIFQFTKSKTDYSIKDDNGNTLSKKAAKHYAKYRVRWSNWENNFWVKWNIKPYHTGNTWKEYRKLKKGKNWRFWGEIVKHSKKKKGPFKYICDDQDWIDKISGCCDKVHDWGHPCKGFVNEGEWLPCLHPKCVEENPDPTFDQDDDTFWSIWYISGLGDQPCIQLGCKHIFHVECIKEKIKKKWAGPRITFLFKTCPSWK